VGEAHALAGVAAGMPVVLGTTGVDVDGQGRIDAAARSAGVPVLFVPNFAITAVVMMRLAVEAARVVPDCAIVEEHHTDKKDRPSGTATRTADLIEEVTGTRPPISSLRLDGVVANQSVIFGAPAQTLEIRHVTTSREAFVPGVLLSIRRIGALVPGLHVGLDAVLD
jgi:4-hydroxy-tetrahydrodipicolinate reductase